MPTYSPCLILKEFSATKPEEFANLLRCLDDAGRAWSRADVSEAALDRRAKPFHSILNCSPYEVDDLSSRCEAATVEHKVRPVRL